MRPRGLPLLALLLSCGPAPVPEAPPPAPPAPSAPSVVTPARWFSRWTETLEPVASRRLPEDAGVLDVSEHGQRWIAGPRTLLAEDAGAGPAPIPVLDTATILLPERASAIAVFDAGASKRWAFFGASGRAFVAASPLGAIDEVRPSPAEIRAVSAGNAAGLALTATGDLLRTTDGGAHWAALKPPVLASSVPYAIAMRADGAGVVLAAPQRAAITADDGATWAPLSLPPDAELRVLERSEDGEIWLADETPYHHATHRLEPRAGRAGGAPTFVVAPPPERRERPPRDAELWPYEWGGAVRALAGRRVLTVIQPRDKPLRMQVGELDREGEWRDVPEVGAENRGCALAATGNVVELGCIFDAKKADAGEAMPYRYAFRRSVDGGTTWSDDGELPLYDTSAVILPGPDGWLAVWRGCPEKVTRCVRMVLRPGAGQPFGELGMPPNASMAYLTVDEAHRKLLAIGIHREGSRSPSLRFYSWESDGTPITAGPLSRPDTGTGEQAPFLGTPLLAGGSFRGSMTVDEQGAIVIVGTGGNRWSWLRSGDGGHAFELAALGPAAFTPPTPSDQVPDFRTLSLAGSRGLAEDNTGRLWETATSGRAWVLVAGHRGRGEGLGCNREGCVIGHGRRLGWDLAGEGDRVPALAPLGPSKKPDPLPGAAPLKCTSGELKAIGDAFVDDLAELELDAPPGGGLVVPVRTKTMGLDLLLVGADGGRVTTKTVSLFGAAPNQDAIGSSTAVVTSPAGVVARRATYPVDAGYADVWLSPVSAEVAWWRPGAPRAQRARVPPLGKGRMRGKLSMAHRGPEGSGVLTLTRDGVVYRPDIGVTSDLFTFSDRGRQTKVSAGVLQSAGSALRTPAGLALLDVPPPSSETPLARVALADGQNAEPFAWMLAPLGSKASVVPQQRGDEGVLVVASSATPDGPTHGYLVPVRPAAEPSGITDLDLSPMLSAHPPACGGPLDPAAVRVALPLPRAVRHVVLLDVGSGPPTLMRAEAVSVVVPPQGPPCASAWIARDGGDKVAIVPVGAGRSGWWIGGPPDEIQGAPGVSVRALGVRPLRCEEAPGLPIPEKLGFRGF